MRLFLPILLGLGCTPEPQTVTTPLGTDAEPSDTAAPSVSDTVLPGDPIAALQSGLPVDDVLLDVAWSEGWPLVQGDTTWFVVPADGASWSLAGDHNDWTPEPMVEEAGYWILGVDSDFSAGSGYKFVRNDTEWLADPTARHFAHDDYGELSYVVPPTDRAHLQRWPQLPSDALAPRDLVVYVPAGAGPFDVIYAHDGQNLFDPAAIWGGWRLTDALAAHPGVMVVGLYNTADRMSEYVHVDDHVLDTDITATGDAYAALVHEVVRPHIEAAYPTTGHDGLLGSSLGGLISLHIAATYPGEYDVVMSLSGTLGWGRFEASNPTIQERWLQVLPDTVVYVDSGGDAGPDGACQDLDGDGFVEDDPDSSDNYCETRQFADALAGAGYTWDDTLFHWHEPGAPHQENAWADRVFRPLQIFVEAR